MAHYELSDKELAWVLAGLRSLASESLADNTGLEEVVTDGGRYLRPKAEELDALAERLNCGAAPEQPALSLGLLDHPSKRATL